MTLIKPDVKEKAKLTLLKHLLYQSSSIVFYLTANFQIIQTNNVVERLFDLPQSDFVDQSLFDIVRCYFNPVSSSLCELFGLEPDDETPLPSAADFGITKHYHWELIESIDKAAEQSGFILIGYDVTTYAKHSEDYKQISVFLKQLIVLMPNYVVWKDTNSVCLGCNDNFAKAMSLSGPNAVIGKTAYGLLSEDDAKACEADDNYVITTGKCIIDKEIKFTFPNKGEVMFSSTRIPIYESQGKVMGVLCVLRDITEQKQVEEKILQEKEKTDVVNQTTSDFLASMSHDLRTPLNSIIMSSQFLQESSLHDDERAIVDAMAKSSKMLLRLVEDILNFTKIEAGKLELHFDCFDLRETAEEIFGMMAHKAMEKKIDLILSYGEFVPRHVMGDSFCFHRILINLIDNAIKFTQSGYVFVKFDGHKIDGDKANILITIEDTGIGIEKERLQFIFERFTRIDPTYRGRHKGTGLGLATVKELVKKMDGYIAVTSRLNKGSLFTVTLPFAQQKVAPRYSLWSKHFSNLSVLVVDDLRVRGQALLKQIATNKSKLVDSSRVVGTLEEVKKNNLFYDIILIDNQLTKIDALALAKLIRKDSYFKASLLVYLTHPCPLSSIKTARTAGFFVELIKPIKPSELIYTLGNSWGQWLSAQKSKQYLLSTLKPAVLLVEGDLLLQKILKLMLNELGYMPDVRPTYTEKVFFNDQAYDIIILDVDSIKEQGLTIVKNIRSKEDKGNPIPIILVGENFRQKDILQLSKLGPNYLVNKPIDHLEFKQTLLQCLFPFNEDVF